MDVNYKLNINFYVKIKIREPQVSQYQNCSLSVFWKESCGFRKRKSSDSFYG